VRIKPQRESYVGYESTLLTTKHLHVHMQVGVNNLPKVVTWQCSGWEWELNRGPFGLDRIQRPNHKIHQATI